MAHEDCAVVAPLPFGMPQLDQLLGYRNLESEDLVHALTSTTSLTIVGQDGTGKSLFGLHVASTYQAIRYYHRKRAAEGAEPHSRKRFDEPFVFYVSSDL